MSKAKKNDTSKKGVSGWLLLPVVALAAYFLKDCIPGFGWGGDTGDGTAASSATPSSTTSATATPEAVASSDAPTTIVVAGDRCDGEDCKTACERAIAAKGAVIINASDGSHAVVEELQACLEKGKKKVSIQSK